MAEKNEIAVLVIDVERIAESLIKTNEKVDKLVDSMNKQEVILEKLANIEKNQAESNKRIHKRIDKNEEDIKAILTTQSSEGCPAFRETKAHYDEVLRQSLKDSKDCKDDIEAIKEKPIDIFWEIIKMGIITIFIGGLAYFGIKAK